MAERGIWAAIAYSPADGRHGIFWGADRREEADDIALRHCRDAGGEDCRVLETFRNHRHWRDDDGTGFPYHPCAALASSGERDAIPLSFGSRSAPTRREAEKAALEACAADGGPSRIREWVCT